MANKYIELMDGYGLHATPRKPRELMVRAQGKELVHGDGGYAVSGRRISAREADMALAYLLWHATRSHDVNNNRVAQELIRNGTMASKINMTPIRRAEFRLAYAAMQQLLGT